MREVPERIKGSPGQGLHFSLEFLKIDLSSLDDLELKKEEEEETYLLHCPDSYFLINRKLYNLHCTDLECKTLSDSTVMLCRQQRISYPKCISFLVPREALGREEC